jgi:hypothetical protein
MQRCLGSVSGVHGHQAGRPVERDHLAFERIERQDPVQPRQLRWQQGVHIQDADGRGGPAPIARGQVERLALSELHLLSAHAVTHVAPERPAVQPDGDVGRDERGATAGVEQHREGRLSGPNPDGPELPEVRLKRQGRLARARLARR